MSTWIKWQKPSLGKIYLTCTAASHKGAIKMFWLHFLGAVMSSIFIYSLYYWLFIAVQLNMIHSYNNQLWFTLVPWIAGASETHPPRQTLLNSWHVLSHISCRFSLSAEDGLEPSLVTVDLPDRSVRCLSASIQSKVVNLLSSVPRSVADWLTDGYANLHFASCDTDWVKSVKN